MTTAVRDLEAVFGDPLDPSNPLGAEAILAADERGEVLPAAEQALDEADFGAHYVPTRLGGRFHTVPGAVDAMRPVFAADAALGLGYGLTTMMAGLNVFSAGTAPQQREAADTIMGGERISVAYHEFAHGNDFTANECLAQKSPLGHMLSGRKELINNAQRAAAAVVFARTGADGPRAHSLFLVPTRDPRVRVLPRYTTLGMRGCRLAGFEFDGVTLESGTMIGEEGHGAEIALRSFQVSRVLAAGAGLGPVEDSLFTVLDFTLWRRLYGGKLIELPHAKAVLADAFTDLLIADAVVHATAWDLHVDPAGVGARAAAVKYLVPRLLEGAMLGMAELLGARFYLRTGRWAKFGKHFRDLPALAIGHAGGVSCQLAILPQLKKITRVGGAQAPAAPPEELSAFDFGPLSLRSRAADSRLVALRELVSAHSEREASMQFARALEQLETGAAALAPADLGAAAPPEALALTETYATLVAASAVLEHEARAGESAWTIRARQRLARSLVGRPTPCPPALADALAAELVSRAETGVGFDLAARPVSRRLP
jgi:alkylation response protein AidB-like acyl-CoA dehydrogenase